jgi:putative membrane protein
MHWNGDWSSWWWMPVGMLLLWAFIAIAIVVVVRALAQSSSASDAGGLLDERYARGEIDDEEYRHRRATLRGHRS